MHYGASNVRGSDLAGELVLADANPFSAYRGPSPPAGIPGTESLLANYEWIVAKQEAFVEASDLPIIESNINFGYEDYLLDVKGDIVTSGHLPPRTHVNGIQPSVRQSPQYVRQTMLA